MITVESWTIQTFQTSKENGTLEVSPEYQRRPVWNAKDQMLLVDSVARGVPIGAVTVYADQSAGFAVHEVIDGKQRLTAIMNFLASALVIRTNAISGQPMDDEEFDLEVDSVTSEFHEKRFEHLEVPSRMKLLQYKIPVFVVEGDRAEAIRAFTRMNRTTYALKPQEIRNAFFAGTPFLETAIGAVEELDTAYGTEAHASFFVGMGAISKQQYDRMQDIQLASELLILLIDGPQHRRDTIDRYYDRYRVPSAQAEAELASAKDRLTRICEQLWTLTGGVNLQAYHFPSACENDFYALVGALHERGTLTNPQMTALKDEVLAVIEGFRDQVEGYVAKLRAGETVAAGDFDPLVEEYGRGFLGGQTNSKQRREDRIRVWVDVINGVAATLDPNATFSGLQRRLIWSASADKLCARCGEVVAWPDYQAGHRVSRSLGGRTTVENGQVEHAVCNQRAGAGVGGTTQGRADASDSQ